MNAISMVILGMWYASIATKATLLVFLVKRSLAVAYLGFSVMLCLGTIRSVALVWAFWSGGANGYSTAWISSQPLTIGMYAVVVLEAFYIQARHFRRIRWFGVCLVSLFGGISTALVMSAAGLLGGLWNGVAPALTMLTRNYAGVCALMAGMSWLFFRPLPVSPNARAHVGVCVLFFFGEFVAMTIRYASKGSYNLMALSQVIGQCVPLVSYMMWIVRIQPDGEDVANSQAMAAAVGGGVRRQISGIREVVQALRHLP